MRMMIIFSKNWKLCNVYGSELMMMMLLMMVMNKIMMMMIPQDWSD